MLVLSRRPHEKIVFPHVGITVEVVSVSGQTVRVGVNAPREVLILRGEVPEKEDPARQGGPRPAALAAEAAANAQLAEAQRRELNHRLRNRLNTANLAIHLAQKQLEIGENLSAEKTLERALVEFQTLDAELASQGISAQHRTETPAPRALVVEDDANESVLLAEILRIAGFEVATAADGRCALDYLAEHQRPDVVLLDMRMPRCDGPTTISAIRSNPNLKGLRIVAVSGTQPAELGVPTGPLGIDRWFAKPLDPRRLVTELQRDLGVAPLRPRDDLQVCSTI